MEGSYKQLDSAQKTDTGTGLTISQNLCIVVAAHTILELTSQQGSTDFHHMEVSSEVRGDLWNIKGQKWPELGEGLKMVV